MVTDIGKFATAVGAAGGGFGGFISVLAKSPSVWLAVAAAVVVGTVAFVDWISGAKAAREALKGLEVTAKSWKETAAETFYNQSESLGFFGMSKDDFVNSTQDAQTWMNNLIAVWTDGEGETDEIVQHWTDSFKELTASTRTSLEELRETALNSGHTSVVEQIDQDIAQLDAMDQEIERLLKKRQNGYLTDEEKVRLQDIIDTREAIEVKYHLTNADTDGFDTVIDKLDAEIARAHARGQADADITVYENAVVGLAEGMAAVNAQIDAQYDKEYAIVQLIEDEGEREAAQADLDARYREQRLAGAREYAEALSGVVMPVWEQENIQQAATDVSRLTQVLREYSAATPDEKQGMLGELNELMAGMDEASLVEYIGLLTQIQSLLDSGMDEAEVQAMFPDIDFSTALDQLAAIQQYLNENKWDTNLDSLQTMFGEALPDEMITLTTDLDMTGAQARWDEFAANPGAITTDAIIAGIQEDENTQRQQVKVDAVIERFTEVPEGADKAALSPEGLIAYVSTYAEATTGVDVSALTPENITAIVSGYMSASYLTYVRTLPAPKQAAKEVVEARQLRDQPFRIYRVVPDLNKVTVYARHVFYDLMDNMIKSYAPGKNDTAAAVVQGISGHCLSEHDFTFYSDMTSKAEEVEFTNVNPVEAFLGDEGFIAKYGGELARDWFDVFLVDRVGSDTNVQIREGKNLTGISYDVDLTDVSTRIMPTGQDKDGNVLYLPEGFIDSPLIGNYPAPKWLHLEVSGAKEVTKGDDKKSKSQCYTEMRQAAADAFAGGCDMPTVTLKVDFVNCADTEEYRQYAALQNIFLGDAVRVMAKKIGVSVSMRATQYTYNCLTRKYTELTLGTVSDTLESNTISAKQIPSGSITGAKLAINSVGTGQLQNGAVGSLQIQLAAIQTAHIEAAAITSAVIAEAAITAAHIQDAAISAAKIEDACITAAKIAEASITAACIEKGTITEAEIADASITAAKIALATITSAQIADAAIETAKIADLAVTAAKIANATITSVKIAEAAIQSAHIEDAAITRAKIALLAVGEGQIDDLAVGTAKVQDAAITTAKITDLSVTGAKIANATITNSNIANATIGTAQIALGAITTALIEAGAVGTMQIADGSITDAKIVELSANRITTGTLSVERLIIVGSEQSIVYTINQANGTAQLSQTTIDGGALTQRSISADRIVAGAITANEIAAATILANNIAAGAITTEKLAAEAVDASKIKAGSITTSLVAANFGEELDLSSNRGINLRVETINADIDKVRKAAVSQVQVLYALSDSATEAPEDGWQAEAPEWQDGKMMWQKTVTTYANGSTEESAPTCLSGASGEAATTLRIDSSRGTVFKNNNLSTVLSVVIYHGSRRITDATVLHEVYGSSAHLQWSWQRMDEDRYGVISASDSRLSNDGFSFTLSAADVDTKVTFMCELITD